MKKAAHERLQSTLTGVKQGAVSLWQRLQPYSFLLDTVDGDFLRRMKEKTDAEVQRDTVKALGLSETLLSMMLEVVSGTHDASTARFGGGAGGSGSAGAGVGGAGSGGNGQGDAEDTSDMGSAANAPDSTCASAEEVPSMRNNIRVRSNAHRAGAERLLEANDENDGPRWSPSLGGGLGTGRGGSGGGGAGSGVDTGLESDDEHAMEDIVPSRTFLKLCSSRQHTETIRKIESDERKKKLAERMETADETEKATLTSKLARKRQQDLAMVTKQPSVCFKQTRKLGLEPSLTYSEVCM